jgi:hypothetical protein
MAASDAKGEMTRPADPAPALTFVRGLHDPVRSLQDALREITDRLAAELSTSDPAPLRSREIRERLRLIQTVLNPEVGDDKRRPVHHRLLIEAEDVLATDFQNQ